MKKQYTEPKVKSVKLDAEQAILQVCQTDGAYFNDGNLCYGPGANLFCGTSVKGGGRAEASIGVGMTSDAPSS
ncbi:MAG: hypothetical protein PHQ52_08060 [Candidatus Omnitrophica bacterium]|nr:hypothetical protein [Candidatus Omnitrophota bacterium]